MSNAPAPIQPAPTLVKHYLLYGSERYALAILRPLQEAIRARGHEAAWFFDGPGAEDLIDGERLLTVAEVRAWNPIAVITSSNHLPHFFPGVKVETFHGFDAGKPRHVYVRGFFDLYCTTGPRDTKAFGEVADQARPFHGHRNRLAQARPLHARNRRRLAAGTPAAGHSLSLDVLTIVERRRHLVRGNQALSRDGRWRWIVTFHPKMNPEITARYKALQNEFLRFAENDNILELFPQVDMMCSDTSSALSEFLLTGKPVVTFKNRRPGPQLIDIDDPAQFEPAIERALARPPELIQAIREFADAIHPYRDGRSSERVLDAVDTFIAAGARNRRRKPWNPWRKLKLRRRIGYWGPA
jgi:CDP-glycerol glycerophosphotransferase (TagB/SpsB family)